MGKAIDVRDENRIGEVSISYGGKIRGAEGRSLVGCFIDASFNTLSYVTDVYLSHGIFGLHSLLRVLEFCDAG